MRLSSVQLNYLQGKKLYRNVLTWSDYYWPNSTLVYSVGKGMTFSDYMSIMAAMSDISSQTCVRFRRTYDLKEPQVILQRTELGCWSHIGYQGEKQTLNLGVGCMSQGIIQHELLHALALLHMHNDPRRNQFVKINLKNVREDEKHNFQIYDSNDFNLGYDYDSVMHYGPYAFSRNGRPTIVPLQKGVKIGQRLGLSQKDVLKLKRIYC
ncbi:seminal metalloprotease 1 [Drosophila innubila]|uniref:seminal metalloprotease 1 n=1 Tax=Drosophila innubila TaxID=198719 RepID=UPI00148D0198|nr:seminal metalloprotease 1 [Drosophila innubila]